MESMIEIGGLIQTSFTFGQAAPPKQTGIGIRYLVPKR